MHDDEKEFKEQLATMMESMEKVKDLDVGDLIRVDGIIYEIKMIGASPAWSPHGVNMILTVKEKQDFSEKLADLADMSNKNGKIPTWMRTGRHG